jgi:hypothetical protein
MTRDSRHTEITFSSDYRHRNGGHHPRGLTILIRNRRAQNMLQWRNGRLVAVVIAVAALAMAIGNWGWESFTWGW